MDVWYFPRTSLAEKYLQIFNIGITANLGIIAPRRKGKTLFVLNDLSPLARKKNYIPVYASLWQNINTPHEGLILALEETIAALDNAVPFSRLLKTKIKKASIGNELTGKVAVEFAENPQRPSSNDLTRLEKLLAKLQKKAKNKTVLLIVDEVQHLATSEEFSPLSHALRTMLDKRLGTVKAIFTGSSRHYMNLLFNESHSPFYHFIDIAPFPELNGEFIDFLTKNLKDRHHIALSKEKLAEAFSTLDLSPYWMMKLITRIITFRESIKIALDYVLALIEANEGFSEIAKKMKPIDKIVFLALSSGQNPFSKSLLVKIENETTLKGAYSNVQRSLQRLIEQNVVSQIEKGEYKIEKPSLKRYLIQKE